MSKSIIIHRPFNPFSLSRLVDRFPQAMLIRHYWAHSKAYRRILIASLVYAVLRLLLHLVMIGGMALYGQSEPEIPVVPQDLEVYLEAAAHLQQGQDLYLNTAFESTNEPYYYAPAYAIVFLPFLWLFRLSPLLVSLAHTGLHVLAYGYLYYLWGQIFKQAGLEQANKTLALTLPVWLLFSAFWADLGFLNIYILMALLATLLLKAILEEQLGWAVLWLTVILQTKPQWAFALAVPLLIGRFRFFFKLLTLSAIAYMIMVGITLLISGPGYGWQQHVDYVHFLTTLGDKYPWRTPADPFLGYNHAIKQIAVFRLGISSATDRLVVLLKCLLLAPLLLISIKTFRERTLQPDRQPAHLSLDLAFVYYLAAFIWLDVVWELTLSIAIFSYLLAAATSKRLRLVIWAIFLPYALLDIWQVLSFIILGESVILPGFYIATDPAIYVPIIMFLTIIFYAVLARRLSVDRNPSFRPQGEIL